MSGSSGAPNLPPGALDGVATWGAPSAVGVADLTTDGPLDRVVVGSAADRSFPWASVTKPATALAILVAAEEGILSLDEPAGPPGSTVRHLLAHASGLGPDPGPPVARPGTTRIYSNPGYLLLGELVESRSQMRFDEYLREGVLGPLGMDATTLDPAAEGAPSAAGLSGPLVDLVRLGRAWAVPAVVSAETLAAATSVAFPGLSGVVPGFGRFDHCDWGLGVEIRDDKHPHWTGDRNAPSTYGHFGRSGAFLWIDPVASVLCAGLCERPFGAWAARAWPRLADDVVDEVTRRRSGADRVPGTAPRHVTGDL